jgi:uncharacterized MAPEG superfamily protein
MLSNELTLLALYGILVIVTLMLQALASIRQFGLGYMLAARDEPRALTGMPARLNRALGNSITALALVAPPVLILAVQDAFKGESLIAMQLFTAARFLYLPTYLMGIPILRTGLWSVGFIATTGLYILALEPV